MKTIEVVFDGTTFVPTEAVDLPAGTKVSVAVPDHGYAGPRAGAPDPSRPPTPEQQAVWVEFMRAVRATPPDPLPVTDEHRELWDRLRRGWEEAGPPFSSVEEEMAYIRGRPWPIPLSPLDAGGVP